MNRLAAMPLVWLSVLFLAGIALSGSIDLPMVFWLAAAALALAGLFLEKRASMRFFQRDRLLAAAPIPLSGLLLVLFGGAALYQMSLPNWGSADLAWYNGRFDVEVTGWVADIPEEAGKSVSLRIEAQTIRTGAGRVIVPVRGRMMVKTDAAGAYHYGERLQIRGNLVSPPGNETFSYREYLARQGIYSWLSSPEISRLDGQRGSPVMHFIFRLREKLESNIYHMLPPDEAALLIGVLLGDDDGLPKEAQDAFRETGTAHILAVSGFNISILVALLAAFFRRIIPRLWSLIPVLVGIILFCLMIGGQASVVRAAVMGCAAQVGLTLGRRPAGGSALLFSAAVMSLFNPFILWDIGFQLSFAATFGILLWGDALTNAAMNLSERLLPPSISAQIAGWLAEFLLITLAAQIFTLPISAFHFQTFSWIGLAANPLVLPPQQILMILGGLAALLSLLFLPLGQLLAWLAWPFCAYTLACVRFLANASQGTWQTGEVSFVFVCLFYAGLLALTYFWKNLLPFFRKAAWPAALLASGVLTILVWRAYFTTPDGQLHITRVDYGSETVYYLITPGGNRVLINGMTKPQETASLIGRQSLPFQPHLDALFLTGEQDSYQKGLPVFLNNTIVDQTLVLPSAGNLRPTGSQGEEGNPSIIQLQTGQVFSIGDGAQISVLQTGRDCADLEVVYNRLHMWLSQCHLPSTEEVASMDWSVISLSQPSLGKEDLIRLGRLKSNLVIARLPDPGLISKPNWVPAVSGSSFQIISNGQNMIVGSSSH
ncbi:MAG: ComEC/Rec2 family competence protein [Anaerolineaceae bacterium]